MSRSALLVMDLQRQVVASFCDDPTYLDRMADAIAAARSAGVPVLHVKVQFRRGYPDLPSWNKTFRAAADLEWLIDDDPQTDFHPSVAPEPGDMVFVRRRVSSFFGTDLESYLRTQRIDHLVMAGIATSGCVLSAVRSAADRDYRITVLADGCADNDHEVHRVLLEKVMAAQAEIVSVADWKAKLAAPRRAATVAP